ncbi:MAG: ABC transporter permease [Paludibacteraceae bacterium]|nr:ABC transporter permease [Paludibacteraceae bacterium]MBP6284370.1 ABC transporter permease [Paludibacteraceae bacterium]
MFDLDRWQEIWHTIKQNKLRSVMTAFGVFWGIFMLVIMLGSGKALENGIMDGTEDFERNSCFMFVNRTTEPYKGLQRGRSWAISDGDLEAIESSVEGVKFTVPYVYAPSMEDGVMNGTKVGTFSVQGITPQLYEITPQVLVEGHLINELDVLGKRKVCVIGEKVREQLFLTSENPIGTYIRANGIYFQVVGVTKAKSKRSMGSPPESTVFIPYSTAKQVFNLGEKIWFFSIVGNSDADIGKIEEEAKEVLKARNSIAPSDNEAIFSFNMKQEFQQVEALLFGIQLLIWIVGIGTLLAGIIGVSNIMLITIRERTKEIGIRRAIGATPSTIMSQIIEESFVLTLLAGIGGLVLGVWVLDFANGLLPTDDVFFKNPHIDFGIAILATFIMSLFGVLAGIVPARRAIRIKPIDAIREE